MLIRGLYENLKEIYKYVYSLHIHYIYHNKDYEDKPSANFVSLAAGEGDLNNDGIVDIYDMVKLSKAMGNVIASSRAVR